MPRLASGVVGALAPVAVVAPFAVAQHRAQKVVAVRLETLTADGQGPDTSHGVHFRRVEHACQEWAAPQSLDSGMPESDIVEPDCPVPEAPR